MAESTGKFSPATWVPLGSAVLVGFTIWKGADWIDNRLDASETAATLQAGEVRAQFQSVREHLDRLDQRLSAQLTWERFSAWRDMLEVVNKGVISVPPAKRD